MFIVSYYWSFSLVNINLIFKQYLLKLFVRTALQKGKGKPPYLQSAILICILCKHSPSRIPHA